MKEDVASESRAISTLNDRTDYSEEMGASMESSSQLRQWFIRLSADERAAALGFVDVAMVSALAKAVVVSSSSTAPSASSTLLGNNNKEVGGVDDLAKIVCLKAIADGVERVIDERSKNNFATVNGKNFDWESRIHLSVLESICNEVVEQPLKAVSVDDNGGKNLNVEALAVEGVDDCTMAVVSETQAESALIGAGELPKDIERNCLPSPIDKDIRQSDAFRIRNQLSNEGGDEQIIPITTSDTLNVATDVAINTDEHDGNVFRKGDGIISGEELEQQNPTNSVEDTTDTTTITTTTNSIKTESHLRATSLTEQPQVLSINPTICSSNSEENLSKTINEVMGNICTIFPAVVNLSERIASRDSYSNTTFTNIGETTTSSLHQSPNLHHPFITLHPYYLHQISGEDLLLALDELVVAGSLCDRGFLPTDRSCCVTTSLSWMDHIRALMTTDLSEAPGTSISSSEASPSPVTTPSEALSIPLYMLVLARLQLSVLHSYQNYKNVTPSIDVGDVCSTGSVDGQAIKLHSDDGEGRVDAAKFQTLQSLMESLKTVDPRAIGEILSIFAIQFPPEASPSGTDVSEKPSLENYLLQPISVFLNKVSSNLAGKNHQDVSNTIQSLNIHLNTALNQQELVLSLKGQFSHAEKGSSAAAEVMEEAIIDIATETGNEVATVTADTTTATIDEYTASSPVGIETQGSKKSKKKKKKKQKKRNAGSSAATDLVEVTQAAIIGNENDSPHVDIDSAPGFENTAGTGGQAEKTTVDIDKALEVVHNEIGGVADMKLPLSGKSGYSGDKSGILMDIVAMTIDPVEVERSATVVENASDKKEPACVDPVVSELDPVTPSISFEAETSTVSSVDSHEELARENANELKGSDESDMYVSNHGATNVVQAKSLQTVEALNSTKTEDLHNPDITEDDQDDEWETVEAKPRGSRKKAGDKGNHVRSFSQSSNFNTSHGANSKKKAPRTKEARNRMKTRKIAKDILSSVLDTVDDEIQVRSLSRERVVQSSTENQSATKVGSETTTMRQNSGATLRDVLLGSQGIASAKICQPSQKNLVAKDTSATKPNPMSYSETARVKSDKVRGSAVGSSRTEVNKGGKIEKATLPPKNNNGAPSADQNTIPTVPETLSAVSTNSAFTPSMTNVTQRDPGVVQSTDSSTEESVEADKGQDTPTSSNKEASPSPPLPTLLSPGNNNSASSSVASSLDAPHAGHHGNLSHPSENDVGYHLLDVCDRLSGEIAVFMKRREDALKIRRQERGLVLDALGETLRSIWPGMCNVEMYGSCATNLDLPSSDLDVVVCGLDRPIEVPAHSPSKAESDNSNKLTAESGSQEQPLPKVKSHQEFATYPLDQNYAPHRPLFHHMHMIYGHMSLNAERVLRLAMELEQQPWAVHVKAIPTASVPVIKVLADPARLPGAAATGNGDWLMQHTMAKQASSIKDQASNEGKKSNGGTQPSVPHFASGEAPPLWRGADVVNGLLKVDITFEGPEHGGIGSTKFSSRVVESFAKETDLAPEWTPQVQVLMVLKELLAQRRLNEPFSGGLSSYALLLLVISVIAERGIICEELEKVERQRMVVAAGGGNSALRSPVSIAASNDTLVQDRIQRKKEAPPKPGDARPKTTKALINENSKGSSVNEENTAVATSKATNRIKETAVSVSGPEESDSRCRDSSKSTNIGEHALKAAVEPKSSSWASVAKKSSSSSLAPRKSSLDSSESNPSAQNNVSGNTPSQNKILLKPSSFADAVAKGAPSVPTLAPTAQPSNTSAPTKKGVVDTQPPQPNVPTSDGQSSLAQRLVSAPPENRNTQPGTGAQCLKKPQAKETKSSTVATERSTGSASLSSSTPHRINTSLSLNNPSTDAITSMNGHDFSLFPQGFNDVIEVLCSGEATSGKLLMHILLFYGQHFDSQSTAIDYSGTHNRDVSHGGNLGYSIRSPYLQRRSAGTYDPITGMLTVDPIVVYDPLEGAENNNVARSCFAWSSIRWVFAQSYMTLSSAVETNASQGSTTRGTSAEGPSYGHDESGHVVVDPSSPLLELLLSF